MRLTIKNGGFYEKGTVPFAFRITCRNCILFKPKQRFYCKGNEQCERSFCKGMAKPKPNFGATCKRADGC